MVNIYDLVDLLQFYSDFSRVRVAISGKYGSLCDSRKLTHVVNRGSWIDTITLLLRKNRKRQNVTKLDVPPPATAVDWLGNNVGCSRTNYIYLSRSVYMYDGRSLRYAAKAAPRDVMGLMTSVAAYAIKIQNETWRTKYYHRYFGRRGVNCARAETKAKPLFPLVEMASTSSIALAPSDEYRFLSQPTSYEFLSFILRKIILLYEDLWVHFNETKLDSLL